MRTRKSKKAKKVPQGCALGAAHARARTDAAHAVFHLRLIQHGGHIVELYRKFFPKEFACDAPDYGSAQGVIAYYDRFAALVDKRLFPVWEFSAHGMTCDEPEHALMSMGIVPINNYLWYERCQSDADLHIVEKLVASAWDKNTRFPDIDFHLPPNYTFAGDLLDPACEEEKGMLSRLALVARAILGRTNNVWIDISEEEYGMAESPDWTEDQIKFLADEFAEAKQIKKQVEEFLAWADSPGKIERIKRLLRQCWVPEGQRVRVKAKAAAPLVETLGGVCNYSAS